jgi:hypothetical protein
LYQREALVAAPLSGSGVLRPGSDAFTDRLTNRGEIANPKR